MSETTSGWAAGRNGSFRSSGIALLVVSLATVVPALLGCEDAGKVSAVGAQRHVQLLAQTAQGDVAEIRAGLARGAEQLGRLWKGDAGKGDADPAKDLSETQLALQKARNKVQDLRVAKSTFFAVTDTKGIVIRSDQESDLMAGKDVFAAFPRAREALSAPYVETTGALEGANGVKGKPDGQWLAAAPIRLDGAIRGLYVTGWAWSLYAYRLEFKLRGEVKTESTDAKGRVEDEPLLYVYVVTKDAVIGAPPSPQSNADEIQKLDVLAATAGGQLFSKELELTGREFGLGAMRVPELGSDIAVVVLRSET